MFIWHKEPPGSGNQSKLFRAWENLELTIGSYEEAQELDDKGDFEISLLMEKLGDILEKKMPKAWNTPEEE